ncbi:MAG: potassium channel family protein [Gaiellaceae bacterium]
MAGESRLERWLDGEIKRARSPRGAAVIIAVVTTTLTVGAGLLMTIVDHKEFGSVGVGLWWAVQTVTTVGYGDHVPADVVGRLLASAVMLIGIGFVTVITAAITSAFVAQAREERGTAPPSDQLAAIADQLDRIEKALDARP